MGLTEKHLLDDGGGAWEPIEGWPDKPDLSVHPQPLCCQPTFLQHGAKYPRKEYLALLDVMYQAIDDYKEAVEELQSLVESGPQRTEASKNDVAIGEPRPESKDIYITVVDHYRTVVKKIEQQINFVSWMLTSISEVRDDDGERNGDRDGG